MDPHGTTLHRGRADLGSPYDLRRGRSRGFVHARDIDDHSEGDAREVAFRADAPVIVASIRKIAVAVAYARQAATGALDRAARHTITAANREGGVSAPIAAGTTSP